MNEDMSWDDDLKKAWAESLDRFHEDCREFFYAQREKKDGPVCPSRVTEGPLWETDQ